MSAAPEELNTLAGRVLSVVQEWGFTPRPVSDEQEILILCLCLHESQLTAGRLSHAEYAAAVNRLARAAELLEVNDAR